MCIICHLVCLLPLQYLVLMQYLSEFSHAQKLLIALDQVYAIMVSIKMVWLNFNLTLQSHLMCLCIFTFNLQHLFHRFKD